MSLYIRYGAPHLAVAGQSQAAKSLLLGAYAAAGFCLSGLKIERDPCHAGQAQASPDLKISGLAQAVFCLSGVKSEVDPCHSGIAQAAPNLKISAEAQAESILYRAVSNKATSALNLKLSAGASAEFVMLDSNRSAAMSVFCLEGEKTEVDPCHSGHAQAATSLKLSAGALAEFILYRPVKNGVQAGFHLKLAAIAQALTALKAAGNSSGIFCLAGIKTEIDPCHSGHAQSAHSLMLSGAASAVIRATTQTPIIASYSLYAYGILQGETLRSRHSAQAPASFSLMRQAIGMGQAEFDLERYSHLRVPAPSMFNLSLAGQYPASFSLMRRAIGEAQAEFDLERYNRHKAYAESQFSLLVSGGGISEYSLCMGVSGAAQSQFQLERYRRLEASASGAWSLRFMGNARAEYSLMARISSAAHAVFELSRYARRVGILSGQTRLILESSVQARFSLSRLASGRAMAGFPLLRSVSAQSQAFFDLQDKERHSATAQARFDLLPSALLPSLISGLTVTLTGREVGISGATIRADLDSPYWQGSLELAGENDFNLFQPGIAFTLHTPGEDFSLVVESRSRQKQYGQNRWQVNFASPTCLLGVKYAQAATVNDTAGMASEKAAEILGLPIDWNAVDWMILSGRLATDGATPLEAAQIITTAAGLRMGTHPDASIYVEPYYPRRPSDWGYTTADITLSDWEDIISLSENFQSPVRFNSIQISDIEEPARVWTFSAEKNQNNGNAAKLFLHSYPWSEFVEVGHTGSSMVRIVQEGVVLEDVTDEVEFKAGKASTSKPVYEMNGYIWRYADLGEISVERDTNELTASGGDGYSIAQISYKTRYIKYRVSNPNEETTQFLAIELD